MWRFTKTAVAPALLFALGAPALAAPPGQPRVLERAFRLRHFEQCGYQGPVPTGPGRPPRDLIADAECSPGGPWGDFVYLAATKFPSDPASEVYAVPILERVDFQGNSELCCASQASLSESNGLGGAYGRHVGFAALGWRGGDLLFSTYKNIPVPTGPLVAHLTGFDPLLASLLRIVRLDDNPSDPAERIGSAVTDPSGDFGFDLFYQADDSPPTVPGGIVRIDAAGNETVFADESVFTGATFPEMRFGPGGGWGTDLYVAGFSFTPDGTRTAFPVDFTEFDWAPGPGFDGDMFARIAGQDPGDIYRVKPSGEISRFARNLEGAIAACTESLWIANQDGCWVVERRWQGPRKGPIQLR